MEEDFESGENDHLPSLTRMISKDLEKNSHSGQLDEEVVCHACGVKTTKARLHYGGITCYPCRSFFRRATVNKKRKSCKKDGRCKVKLEDRKSCNACRYNECVHIGMRPHLVLSEDQIQERFKNLPTRKKKENLQNSEGSTPSLERDSNEATESRIELGTTLSQDLYTTFPHSSNDNWIMTPGQYTSTYNTNIPGTNSSSTSAEIESQELVTRCKREQDLTVPTTDLGRPSVLNMKRKFVIRDANNYLTSLKSSSRSHSQAQQIGQQKSVIMLSNRKIKNVKESQYLFNDDIKEENYCIFGEADEESEDDINKFIQSRNFIEYAECRDMNVDKEVDTMLLKTLNSIDIKEIENMYTIEEKCYIQFMGQKFREKWCEVNIGPDVMSDYILWCKKQRPLSQEMFQVVSRATRERFTRMVETTDEFQHLNIHDKFFLLKSNLKYADTVTMIRKLSFLNPQDDYFDSWGSEDKVIWDESGMKLGADTMSNIFKEMPFDLRLKQQFVALLSQCKLPILADKHVFSLLVAIVIFSSGEIQLIERERIDVIRDGYLTMLRRYVRQSEEDAEDIINKAMMIISFIPKLSELFRKMNIIENI
eukprot:GFUD01001481.1.p1 GENE.GFUD01001481.1~~GFUD01001481.1.p1  ORF type:complete len:593 (+),score=137.30 GFUD01001481.1:201-1979(+)